MTTEYTAVIRTLGTAGEKYQKLLDSLMQQTIRPKAIVVYIAEGYAKPKETVGVEQYVWVKKGMVAQRALRYEEVKTEWMLCIDDDVYLPPTSVETIFSQLYKYDGDVISPDVFPNAQRPVKSKLMLALSGRMLPHRDDGKWAYRVMRNGGYSYNNSPSQPVYRSQTNAGPCFLCRKSDFLRIHFEDELWHDSQPYALGDDQTMFYKMHLYGLKVLTSFSSGIEHLDAGNHLVPEKERKLIYCDVFFKTVFWWRFLYGQHSACGKALDVLALSSTFAISFLLSAVKCRADIVRCKYNGLKDAVRYIRTHQWKPVLR